MNFVFMNNNTLVCRFKSNIWPYFIVDDFEAVYSAQKDSLSNERLEQSDRPLRTSFSWLFSVFFCIKSLFWSSKLFSGTLQILYLPVVIQIKD